MSFLVYLALVLAALAAAYYYIQTTPRGRRFGRRLGLVKRARDFSGSRPGFGANLDDKRSG